MLFRSPPPPTSSLYDDLDDTSNAIVKKNLVLSHSPPPVMPSILRQGSRPRAIAIDKLASATNEHALNHSPTSTTTTHEDLATKKFEEQLALLDATSSKLTMINMDQSSGSEEDEQIERICRMNNTATLSGPVQFKFNRTQNVPLKTSLVTNEMLANDDEIVPVMASSKKKRLHRPDDPSTNAPSSASDGEKEPTKKRKASESKRSSAGVQSDSPVISLHFLKKDSFSTCS